MLFILKYILSIFNFNLISQEDISVANEIARIGVYGDIHLSSKNYGAHKDYPRETLDYFSKITEIAEKRQLTHLIGCGDFTFGRFHTLEYRLAVEEQLEKQYKITNGNRYELKGNHDIAGYGKTERDYYIAKGLLKPSTNITIGNLNITMVDYGQTYKTSMNILDDESHYNFVIAHDFYKFRNSNLPNFGTAIELDGLQEWFGTDFLICGHIHKILDFSGYIQKDGQAHECLVSYLGCMSRPAYREGMMDTQGRILVITVFDDGHVDTELETINLWSLQDAFNLDAKQVEAEQKQEKMNRVDISDVVKQLDAHDRNVGNPEDIIQSLVGIDDRYKNKAIELLKGAMG